MIIKSIKNIIYYLFLKPKNLLGENNYSYSLRKDLFRYYYKYSDKALTHEEREALRFFRKNPIHYFPYNFIKKYNEKNVKVYHDKSWGLNYVMHNNMKLYFKKGMDKEKIKKAYLFLLLEQDKDSPHYYFFDKPLKEYENIVVIDAGAAEGIYGLEIITKVKKLIMIESDKDWILPLQATFSPWHDKVIIINAFISNKTEGNKYKLDDLNLYEEKPDFIKADIEGEEINLLLGAKKILTTYNPDFLLCLYHRPNDAEIIYNFLKNEGYECKFSEGLIAFLNNWEPPYFRKGLISAKYKKY